MWMSPLIGCVGGMVTMWTLIRLHRWYPGKTLVEYAEAILGKIAGRIVSIVFLIYVIFSSGYTLRQFSDFISQNFLQTTPLTVIEAGMILVCCIAVRNGIEVTSRMTTPFLPLLIGMVALIILPLIADLEPVMPILENGFGPPLLGAFVMQLWFATSSFSAFYIPYVHNQDKLMKWGLLAPLLIGVMLSITNWTIASKLGKTITMYHYPFMILSRYISFFEFFEHLESFVMMIWVVTIFIRLCYSLYAASIGLAQLCVLPDYKPLVLPLGMMIIVFSFWGIPSSQYTSPAYLIPPLYAFLHGTALPVMLLAMAAVRRSLRPKERTNAAPGNKGKEPVQHDR